MNIDIDKLKSKLGPRFLWGEFSLFLEKKATYLIFILLLLLVGYGSFIWYRYVYNSGWSNSRIEEYMRTKEKGTILNKGKFDEIVAEKEKRSADYKKEIPDLTDIFKLE
jgi:hypothetical protein